MSRSRRPGGIIHTYQKYDPVRLPSPTQPPPDMVSPAFQHWLAYGSMRQLTDEELARAVRLDPSQIAGLGPSLDALIEMLKERKRKILAKYETQSVEREARERYEQLQGQVKPPRALRDRFQRAASEEQIYELERVWYAAKNDQSAFSRSLVQLIDRLADKYQIDELAGKYEFTGQTRMTIDEALQVKEELETIDKLLEQLEKARETAQIAIIDLDALAQFAEEADIEQLQQLQQEVERYVREMAEQ